VHYYEPGSTFKIVPLAAALENKLVWPGKQFNCENGVLRSGRRVIRDTSAYGMLTVREILAKSSCIGMVKITQSLEPDVLSEMIERFGFGHKTNIELPGESPGHVLQPERWSSFTQASMSFGQEIGVTVVQMASAMGVIANDGILVPPRIALGTLDSDDVLHPFDRPAPRRILSSETAGQIATMLRGVVTNGTGKRANLPSYTIAGKTGTAQKAQPGGYSDYDYVASFAGYGPASAPRLVGLIVLDSPPGHWHQGGTVAAPVFARIISRALHYMRVPYDRGTPALVRMPETTQTQLASRSLDRRR
jgi:cell division protein FtsI/penicillin-binding protein 2